MLDLTDKAKVSGLRTKTVHVKGRFHSGVHTSAAEKITLFSMIPDAGLWFPSVHQLQAPLRSTVDGNLITDGSLFRVAIKNTLLKAADWHKTLQKAAIELPNTKRHVAYVGFGSHNISASLVQNSEPTVVSLHELDHEMHLAASGSTTESSVETFQKLSNGMLPHEEESKHTRPSNGVNGTNPGPWKTNGDTTRENCGRSDNHESANEAISSEPDLSQYPPHSIAIVGMAGRFPGADSLDQLWGLLISSKVMVEHAPIDRLGLPEHGLYEGHQWWGNFFRDFDAFDHHFFKKSSREALAWDPQQRYSICPNRVSVPTEFSRAALTYLLFILLTHK